MPAKIIVLFLYIEKNTHHFFHNSNYATIVFDANAPILTNNYVNYFDMDEPQSRVLPIKTTQDSVMVSWEGSDNSAGVRNYSVYISKNKGEYQPWIGYTKENNAWLKVEHNSTYSIYSLAVDNTGREELFDKALTLEYTYVGVNDSKLNGKDFSIYPNPAKAYTVLQMNRTSGRGLYTVEIYDLSGVLLQTQATNANALKSGVSIPLSNLKSGLYFLRISGDDLSVTKRLTVK